MATLAEYLSERGETQADFGIRAGVRQQVVSRWASAMAIPRPHFVTAVVRVTGGAVTSADFYAAHAARQEALAIREAVIAKGATSTAADHAELTAYRAALARIRQAAPVPAPALPVRGMRAA